MGPPLLQDWSLPDPELTQRGIEQCQQLHQHLQKLELAQGTELIVTSPMRRALQTTHIGLRWLIERRTPVLCHGQWQETSRKPCDTGTPLYRIQPDFPDANFTEVYAEWPQKAGKYAFEEKAILARGQMCRQWLFDRPEKVIAVVSHSAFLRLGVTTDGFGNADYRIYDFDGQPDRLIQRAGTEEGGMGRSWTTRRTPAPADFEEDEGVEPSPLAIMGQRAEQ